MYLSHMKLNLFLLLVLLIFTFQLHSEQPIQSGISAQPFDNRSDSIDIIHSTINIDISNYDSRQIVANTQLLCINKIDLPSQFRFDLRGFTIDSIKLNSILVAPIIYDQYFTISAPTSYYIGDTLRVAVYYRGTPYIDLSDFGGFYWSNTYAYNVGVSFKEIQHSYGRTWMPCIDNFVERSTYEYTIITDSTRKAFCGGVLESKTDLPGGKIAWHWKLNQSIPSYLASVAVAKYATVIDTFNSLSGVKPIQLAALAADTTRLKNSFAHLHDALHIYEDKFGPYHFDRVGYCLTDYSGGAMEHACNITYPGFAANGSLTYETLMAHELSHHWWGDLTTCESATEMWLNEGWAVYCEHVFLENVYNKKSYKDAVRNNHAQVLQFAHVSDSGYHALQNVPLNRVYGSTSYKKGADVVHSLRSYMGDSLFFYTVRNFLQYYAFQEVNSMKLMNYINDNTSFNATPFFTDWVFDKGFAQFSIDAMKQEGGLLKLWLRQRINKCSHYYTQVPFWISVFDSAHNRIDFKVKLNGKCTYIEIPYTSKANYIALDFDEWISDATTDEPQVIKSTGTKNFNYAKLNLEIKQLNQDSVMIRPEHYYVAPDPLKYKIDGLHLHDYRYWNIDGIFNEDSITMNATFLYNGSNSMTSGHLDNSFITNSEDSIVMMHRRDATEDWKICDSFKVLNNGNPTDKSGRVVVYNIKKGQYCFAIYDYRYEDTTSYLLDCNSILQIESEINQDSDNISIYPNPAKDEIFIKCNQSHKDYIQYEVLDLNAKEVCSGISYESNFIINTKSIDNGLYLIRLFNNKMQSTHKIIINK